MRFYWARQIDRTLHPQIPHAIFHHFKVNCDHSGHFDSAAKGDLAVPLGEMQVPYGELRARNVNW